MPTTRLDIILGRDLTPMEMEMRVAYTNALLETGREFWIVWNPASQRPPRIAYNSEDQAWAIAEHLAGKHIGQKFYVMKMVGCAKAETPVTRTLPLPTLASGPRTKSKLPRKTAAGKKHGGAK